MALPLSGSLSLSQVNVELNRSPTNIINLNELDVRTLFGVQSGQISFSNGFGKSAVFSATLVRTFSPTDLNYFDTPQDDQVGKIAVYDNIMVVAIPREEISAGSYEGVIRIYDITTGNIINTIESPVPANNELWPTSIDINSQFIAVGHRGYNGTHSSQGRVYIYDHQGVLQRIIENPDTTSNKEFDNFGSEVKLNSTFLLVAAISKEDSNGPWSGTCFLYSPASGTLLQTITNPNAAGTVENDAFGWPIAMTNTHIAIAANQEDLGGNLAGVVYVYTLSGITATLAYTLPNPDVFPAFGRFGYTLAMNNNYLAVGVPNPAPGRVRVYYVSTGNLFYTLDGPNLAGDTTDEFFEVAANQDLLVVGSPREDVGLTNSGTVFVYEFSTGNLLYTINNPNNPSVSQLDVMEFGRVVATDGKTVVVGSPKVSNTAGNFQSAGAVYVYK